MALLPIEGPHNPPQAPISVLVVDDEAPARHRLLDLLRLQPGIDHIAEADNGLSAVKAIQQSSPDLVFLDVQMPELDGLSVMAAVGAESMPLTIFVTAYDQHAVRAFETNALDYLLKPFSDERFEATMARVRDRLDERQMESFGRRLAQMAQTMTGNSALRNGHLDRLVVKSGGVTRLLRAAEIDWIEASGVYVTLHTGGKELLHRSALADLAERLDPARFIRVHRSAIVNVESILHLESISHGEFDVVLKHGARTRISRSYRAQLEERLGQSL